LELEWEYKNNFYARYFNVYLLSPTYFLEYFSGLTLSSVFTI